MDLKKLTGAALLFVLGVGCGGYLFSRSIPRSFLALGSCQDQCLKANELAGLVASVGILRGPFTLPGAVLESDRCVAIRHPRPEARVHYVLFPKRDIRNITALADEDAPYVLGCFALARALVEQDHLAAYRLTTNGPGLQDIAYLHFHLLAQESDKARRPRRGRVS